MSHNCCKKKRRCPKIRRCRTFAKNTCPWSICADKNVLTCCR